MDMGVEFRETESSQVLYVPHLITHGSATLDRRNFSHHSTGSPQFLSHDSTLFSRHSTGNPSNFLNVPLPAQRAKRSRHLCRVFSRFRSLRTQKSAPNTQNARQGALIFLTIPLPCPSREPNPAVLRARNAIFRVES
jgi:hypothetical protein